MELKRIALIFIVLLASVFSMCAQTVNTEFGTVAGAQNGEIYQFLGIPFAKPPRGDLRWKAPQSPESWKGILSTTNFAPVCPQKKYEQGETSYALEGNEDCLYLNVWTPLNGSGNLPVLVFIHGGGNQQGGASETGGGTQMFFGKNLAERGNAVVVTIQYRLGPLGFLVHPGLEPENPEGTSGNYAVLDQILALRWIKNNISEFGGDPEKVMIFGESAGGVNVGNLLTTPMAAGMFQRACIQSASPVISSYEDAKVKGIEYVDTFIQAGTDVQRIAHMRSLSSDSLVSVLPSPLDGGVVQMNWQAVLDDVVFKEFTQASFQSGNYNKVPLLIGTNSEEMSLSAPQTVFPFMINALIESRLPEGIQNQALILYPPGNNTEEARQSYVDILTDAQFTVNARRTAQCVSQNQVEPVWRYFFTHKHTIESLRILGSYHGMELFYIFNNWENATLGKGILFKPQDDSVQKAMLKYWVNFASIGNPNGTGLVNWPQYQSTMDDYLEIKATPDGSKKGLRTEKCDIWDVGIDYIPCTSSSELENTISKNSYLAFPNPCTDIIRIIPVREGAPFKTFIYDFTGRMIRYDENHFQINVSDLPPSIYVLSIVQNGNKWQTRIMKQ